MEGTFSYQTYQELLRGFEPRDYLPKSNFHDFMGIRIQANSAFPFQMPCKACNGSGKGEESTYCPKCKGAGEIRYIGVMQNGSQTIVLTAPLPKRFAPRFPSGILPAPMLSRGLN